MSHVRSLLWTVSWIPVAATFTQTVGQAIWVQGQSMQPALNPDSSLGRRDLVLLQKWGLHKPGGVQNGEIVVLRSPMDPSKILIKRVLATGGQIVRPRPTANYPKPQVQIPPNHLWVEGDNIHSVDSNNFGPVSAGLVLGKARFVMWPLSRWGSVDLEGGRTWE